MGNVLPGMMMVFFVILVNVFVAFLQTGATNTFTPAGCGSGDNITTCEQASQTSFLEAYFEVGFTGLDGAPAIFNVLYVITLSIILTGGIILLVLGILSVAFGGG